MDRESALNRCSVFPLVLPPASTQPALLCCTDVSMTVCALTLAPANGSVCSLVSTQTRKPTYSTCSLVYNSQFCCFTGYRHCYATHACVQATDYQFIKILLKSQYVPVQRQNRNILIKVKCVRKHHYEFRIVLLQRWPCLQMFFSRRLFGTDPGKKALHNHHFNFFFQWKWKYVATPLCIYGTTVADEFQLWKITNLASDKIWQSGCTPWKFKTMLRYFYAEVCMIQKWPVKTHIAVCSMSSYTSKSKERCDYTRFQYFIAVLQRSQCSFYSKVSSTLQWTDKGTFKMAALERSCHMLSVCLSCTVKEMQTL